MCPIVSLILPFSHFKWATRLFHTKNAEICSNTIYKNTSVHFCGSSTAKPFFRLPTPLRMWPHPFHFHLHFANVPLPPSIPPIVPLPFHVPRPHGQPSRARQPPAIHLPYQFNISSWQFRYGIKFACSSSGGSTGVIRVPSLRSPSQIRSRRPSPKPK